MSGLLVGGIIGEGLKSFVNSYNATQDRMRQQAESDEDRVERRRRTKLDEMDRGVKYNDTTGEYEDLGDGRLNRTERQRIDQLQKSASSLGEQWGLKEYDPLRQELKALLTKGAMKPTGMLNTPTAPASVMEAPQAGATNRIPQMAPKAPRTVTMPRQVAPQAPQVPAAAPLATPAAQPQVDPAYEKMAQQVLNAPIQGYNPKEWSTPPKFVREEMQRRQQKAQEIRMKGMEKASEPANSAQSVAGTYATRAAAAEKILSDLREGGLRREDPKYEMTLDVAKAPIVGKYLKQFGDERLSAQEQAERNFVTAVLRKESGANIPTSEYDIETKKYFPRPGDSEETIKNKTEARRMAIAGLRAEAGDKVLGNIDKQLGLIGNSPATVKAPQAGEVRKGFRFKGGDPSNKNNWVKVNNG